jgi:DNA repair protein RadC
METKITNCIAAEKAVRDVMYGLDHEEVWGLFLSTDNTVISREMLSKGTLTQTSIDNRTVIRRALLNNAAGIILY